MTNQSELDSRFQEAIRAALTGDWAKAVEINSELFEDYPDDTETLNRLGHAYAELGQINKANTTYKKVLEIDPYNPIAKRNMDKLSTLRGSSVKPKETKAIDPEMFLEEPGKTKAIDLFDLAMPKVLVQLHVGDPVILKSAKNDVTVLSEDNKRLGKLEANWGKEIALAVSLGSSFSAIVKAVKVGKAQKDSNLSVFVRETKRSQKLVHPIFPIDTNFTPYVREETLSYLKQTDPTPSTETNENTQEFTEEETPREDVPQEAADLIPTSEQIDDEEEFQELK
jgi:tetratricopeptide (TPR) repeat protein